MLVLTAILGETCEKSYARFLIKPLSFRPILLIFNSKHKVPLGYIVSKFKVHRTKITTVRVSHTKTCKLAAMTSFN